MGRDFWPDGYQPNLETLRTFLRYPGRVSI